MEGSGTICVVSRSITDNGTSFWLGGLPEQSSTLLQISTAALSAGADAMVCKPPACRRAQWQREMSGVGGVQVDRMSAALKAPQQAAPPSPTRKLNSAIHEENEAFIGEQGGAQQQMMRCGRHLGAPCGPHAALAH